MKKKNTHVTKPIFSLAKTASIQRSNGTPALVPQTQLLTACTHLNCSVANSTYP